MRRITLPLLVLIALLLLWLLGNGGDGPAPEVESGSVDAADTPPPLRISPVEEEARSPSLTGRGEPPLPDAAGPRSTLRCLVLGPDGEPSPRSLVMLAIGRVESLPTPSPLPSILEEAMRTIRYMDIGGARSDVDGYATFHGLGAAVYRASAPAPPGLLTPSASIEISDGEYEVVLAYRRAEYVCVEVVDPDGEPVRGALVFVEAPFRSGRTDAQGVAQLEELDPDLDVKLTVWPPLGADVLSEEVDPWPVGDTRIVLPFGLAISGRVVDDQGEPVADANVHRRPLCSHGNMRKTERDGSFRFPGLRAGEELTLSVGPPGAYTKAITESQTAQAGTDDLVFVLPRGGALDVVVRDWPPDREGHLFLNSRRGARTSRRHDIPPSGRVEIRYLDPEEDLILWGTVNDDERFVYMPSVRAQDEALRVDLQEGQPIWVEVDVPDGVVLRCVSAYGPGVYRGTAETVTPQREYRLPGLPDGQWRVEVLGTAPGKWKTTHVAKKVVPAGETVKLTLEPVDAEQD